MREIIALAATLAVVVGIFLKIWVNQRSTVSGKWIINPVGLEPYTKAGNRLLLIGAVLFFISFVWIIVRLF